jgi:autotransporter-associated beta strand protein
MRTCSGITRSCDGGELRKVRFSLAKHHMLRLGFLLTFCLLLGGGQLVANVPGGGSGTGPNVTLVDNGDGTVTMANGIVSIVITKSDATIHQINYTYNNSGTPATYNVLSGGNNGGQFYWEFGGFSSGSAAYSVVANTPDYAEVDLLFSSASSGSVDIHFSMPRGATGFYVTPIWIHDASDAAMSMGECRDNIYSGSIFNWMSVDATRNRLMSVSSSAGSVGVQGAPVECSLWTNGIYAGQYEDKYKYTADYGTQRVWGWSSVGTGGKNIGLWDVAGSVEYYPGGPMKRELMCHIGTTILNTPHGSHFGGGTDSQWNSGEVWAKACGPHFIYCNAITNAITGTNAAAQALYGDALAQADAEASAWPYAWFNNPNYTPASGRGAVKGQIVINDIYNPNASASNLWVGVEQQPNPSSTVTYDFQKWYKPYQFWVKTDANGNFSIPNVIAGANYTLYAFGPGAAGTFQSQAQAGGSAPNELNIPASQFSVTVTAGATNNLGPVTWTPTRIGPTVFEIGYPDRTAAKFRHGEDWWVGDIGPSPTDPMPVWTKFLEYPFDFPSGVNYVVGQSHWTTDWNFVQPVVVDAAGNYNDSTSTITFNLPSAPSGNASLYLALASDFQGPLIVQVNGNNIAGSTGYFPAYSGSSDESDATIREGIHGTFSDNRINFTANLLHAGQNTITFNMRKGGYFANHAMYDYVRLELSSYVPPAPTSVAAYPGNGRNLISWPAQPGATSYNILRTTTSGSGYVSVTNGVTGPVCGSGLNNATYVDSTAINGTTYYYVVQSVNPVDSSANSPESPATTPSAAISSLAPAAPTSVTIGSASHQSVTVNWTPSPGANFYTVYRSTLFNNGGGASNVLGTIVLNNTNTATSFTDTTPTDGSIYSYFVSATSAGGTSPSSPAVAAVPLPAPPSSAPGSLTGNFVTGNIVLHWSAVSGAVGYIIRRSTNSGGPFAYIQNVTPMTFTDTGLNPAATYYYQVSAVNAAGASTSSTATIFPAPLAPISLSAIPGNAQVTLSWTPVPGANGYYLYSGTSSGNETNVVIANYSGTSFTNTSLINGTTYYYVVTSTNLNGESPDSPEASATPNVGIVVTPRSLIWRGDGSANVWDVNGADNFQTNGVTTIFNNGDTVLFDNSGSNNVPVTIAGTPQPALVTFNPTKNYALNGPGSISGTNKLIKTGSGTLTINNTNLYSGGTIISNSTVLPGNIGANGAAWGTGPITLAGSFGGTGAIVQFNGYGGSTGTGFGGCTNMIVVPSGLVGTLRLPPRWGYSSPFTSPLTGGGTLNVVVDYVRDYFSGNWSAFTGTINVSVRSGTGDFRIDNAAGYANAALILNSGVNLYNINADNQTTDIGELGGSATAFIGAGSLGSINPTWRIGAKNTTNTYAGTLADAGVTSLIKTGTGMLILSGTANSYSGSTTINGGTLKVINTNGSATGFGSVNVASGGALAGNGIISGPVTVNPGGALAPGNPLGTLTVSNNLTLAAGSTTFVEVQHSPLTNGAVKILGAFTEGGTLNVTNSGAAALASGDTFTLFNAGSYSGSFASFVLPPLTGNLVWNTNAVKTSGTLSVMALTQPTIAAINVAGGNVVMSGSGGVSGWTYYLLGSTNLSLPTAQWTRITTNQFDNSGNFTVTNAVNPTLPQTFYRIQLQ